PQAFLGLAPTFSTMPTPSAPSSDIWNHGSLAALLGLPSSGGILGQWTQLIGPPTSQTVWNSPTVRTPFLQPVSATTAQLNSNSYQSSVPAHSPKSLGANAGFASTPVESFDRPSEKTLMPGATVARQPIWALASSIRDSIGCLRENNWRFWVE